MKLISNFFILFSTWVFVGLSKDHIGLTAASFVDALPSENKGGDPQLQCVQTLLPCKPYLHSSTPPGVCCVPLVGMINNDIQCLCGVINNPGILRSLNTTRDDAINLARSCGSSVDVSVCKQNGTSPSTPAATPSRSPLSPSSPLSNGTSPSNDNPTLKNAAAGISRFGDPILLLSLFLAIPWCLS